MYIEKTVTVPPYYIPLNAHRLDTYTVDVVNGVVTAVVSSFYEKDTIQTNDSQPLSKYSIVMKSDGSFIDENWVLTQLVNGGEEVPNAYNYHVMHHLVDRNFFKDGVVKTI